MRIRRMIALAVGLVLTVCAGAWGDVAIDEANFPDDVFRAYVSSADVSIDKDQDGYLSDAEIAAVIYIDVSYMGISSLTGIEHFTALIRLSCYENQLTALDVSNNTALEALRCWNNQLTELDVSKNTELIELSCYENQLTTLDITKNTNMTYLNCEHNQLTTLDVSKNIALTQLCCGHNQLTTMDVSKNTVLTQLVCYSNQLTALDVSGILSLDVLQCGGNQLTELDVSKNLYLIILTCNNNQLSELDISKNLYLGVLSCRSNKLTSLDVNSNTSLEYLDCGINNIKALDVSNNRDLVFLDCVNNSLSVLDLSMNVSIDNSDSLIVDVAQSAYQFGLRSSDFSSQTVSCGSPDTTGDSSFPYSLKFSALSTSLDISRVHSLDVRDYYGSSVSYTTDTSAQKWLFTSKPQTITYDYYTGHSGSYMYVTAILAGDAEEAFSLYILTPTAPITLGSSETWTLATYNALGTVTYTANQSWVTFSGDIAIATPPAVGTYTFTITATDNGRSTNNTASVSISLTVTDEAGSIALTESNFPDSTFRSYITEHFDSDSKGYLTESEIAAVTGMDISGMGIADLTGIENFKALTHLYCSGNSLTTLDVTNNSALVFLDCSYNSLTSLDVSGCDLLETLLCNNNDLSSLELSTNTALGRLDAQYNQLTAIDVTNNAALWHLRFESNQVTDIDVSSNSSLLNLICSDNSLSSVDVSSNSLLRTLRCDGNSAISALDVTNNPDLDDLWCYNLYNLSSLNVTQNPKLVRLMCFNDNLASLDVSNNPELVVLNCYGNKIPALDLSANPNIDSYDRYMEYEAGRGDEDIPSSAEEYYSRDPYNYFWQRSGLSQTLNLPASTLESIDNAAYPYKLNVSAITASYDVNLAPSDYLSTLEIYSQNAYDGASNPLTMSIDVDAGDIYFSGKPYRFYYNRDTGYEGSSQSSELKYLDVSVYFDVFGFYVTYSTDPSSITAGESFSIRLWVNNNSGDVTYSTQSMPSGLTLEDSTISGAISTAGTYTFTITATDGSGESLSQTVTLTVGEAETPSVYGITGISITSPAAKSITLSADGGTFSAALSASGTPYGSIVWSLSATQGLSADITGSGSTAALSGTAQPNSSSQDISGTITISAHDDSGTNYSDTLTVIVSGLTQTIDITSNDLTITGISLTPDTLPLSADGGTVNVTAQIQGTPSGDISWSVSPETYTVSPQTGSSVNISGIVAANTSSDDITHTVKVTAMDSVNIVSADFTVIVSGRRASESDTESKDHHGQESQDIPADERPYHEKYSGDSWGDAYIMGSYSDFMDLISRFLDGSESSGKYYSINADLDLSAVSDFQSIGSESNPFRGHFDGGGKTITIPANAQGLFGVVDTDGIAVQNLNVRTAPNFYNGASGSTPPTDYAGGIVQELVSGVITNCTFTGTVTADGEDSSAGGIVGLLSGGTIQNCRVLSGSGIYASHSAGGIAGYVMAGSISGCESDADVDAEFSGGIAGYTESERQNLNGNSYTAASVEVGNDILSIELIPETQTVRAGDPITDIQVSSDNAAAWSFRVSGDFALGLISQDMAVSGTIPAGTQAGTYTITVDALNINGFTASAQAYITVTGAIIESGDVISGDIHSDDIHSDDRRPTPPHPGRRDNVDYVFEIPSGVMYRLAMLFGGEAVYQLTEDEIFSDTWELDAGDSRAIADMYENVVLHLPVMMPKNSGLYMLKLDLSRAGAGKKISLYGITSGGGNVSAAALEDLDYVLLDENGNEISEVPENGIVYAALRLTANREHRGVITTPIELEQGTIQPVEPDETLLEKIADTVKISADKIMFITEENISDPQEPTEAIRSELASRQNELLGKFNTLTVEKSGYYVLKVTLSDDLYERVKNVNVNELKVYALYDDGRTKSADVSASFITGLLNSWELLTLSGEKMEFGLKEFLMVGFLNAGTPFSVYLAKLIIMLLLGGCDSGMGIAGFSVIIALGAVFLIRRMRH